MSTSPARQRLRAILRRPEADLCLAEAALCVAWEDQGACAIQPALDALDAAAGAVRPRVEGRAAADAVRELSGYLFGELGFHGNTHDYSAPQNSYLDRVLETRAGLPITLSVVYLEVGWRLGMPLAGLALPGHFLVQHRAARPPLYIDPFEHGRLWSYADCARQVTAFYGSAPPDLMRRIMAPPEKTAILLRMLRNLKLAHLEREDLPRTLAAIDRILLIVPTEATERRDRGLLLARLGRPLAALEELEAYARQEPRAADLRDLRRQALSLLGESPAQN